MDRIAGQQLITDPRFNMLTFTGSPEAGWKMKEQAGKKKVALELGGNAGVIVTPSANLPLAVSKCLTGAFAYSGQVCIHTQRIYIQESVFDKFCELFTEATRKMVAGPPDAMSTDFSAMIDEENAIRVETWIREATENGAILLAGGKRTGTLVEPTVLTGTSAGMKVCNCEVFGPVVVLEKYKAFKDAVEMINDTEFGLQAGVFTDSLEEMNLAFREIEAGGIIINDVPTFRVDHMPYGGIKNSGFGREGVRYAMNEMTEPKLLVRNQ
jgi:glyceraldehyde-3-phosphate dehydrogenase (NADP+)